MFNSENGHEKIPTLIAYGLMALTAIIQVIFVILKLTNVLPWAWWIVFLPIIIMGAVPCITAISMFIYSGLHSLIAHK